MGFGEKFTKVYLDALKESPVSHMPLKNKTKPFSRLTTGKRPLHEQKAFPLPGVKEDTVANEYPPEEGWEKIGHGRYRKVY